MKKVIVGFTILILLTTVVASDPVSSLNMDNTYKYQNQIEQRIKNIKKTLANIDINSIKQDNISEPMCILLTLLYYLAGIISVIAFFVTLAIDLLIIFIIAILAGG